MSEQQQQQQQQPPTQTQNENQQQQGGGFFSSLFRMMLIYFVINSLFRLLLPASTPSSSPSSSSPGGAKLPTSHSNYYLPGQRFRLQVYLSETSDLLEDSTANSTLVWEDLIVYNHSDSSFFNLFLPQEPSLVKEKIVQLPMTQVIVTLFLPLSDLFLALT